MKECLEYPWPLTLTSVLLSHRLTIASPSSFWLVRWLVVGV